MNDPGRAMGGEGLRGPSGRRGFGWGGLPQFWGAGVPPGGMDGNIGIVESQGPSRV